MGSWKQALSILAGGFLSVNTLFCQLNAHYQRTSIQLPKSYSVDHILDILYKRMPDLRANGLELTLQHDISSPGGRHISFVQSFNGYPIYQAGVKVNMDKRNRITSIISTVRSFKGVSNWGFQFPVADIAVRYAEEIGAYEVLIDSQYQVINDWLYPVYVVHSFADAEVVSYELLVDTRTGDELSREDRGTYFRPLGADTTGRARVFIPNPCTKAEVSYGDLFIDSSDTHTTVFESLMDTVDLKEITFENDSFRLKGPFVHILDRSPAYIAPVASADGDFFFGRDSSGFEDVMAYYHIDKFQRYVQSLGFTNLNQGPIEVDPHGLTSDNSTLVVNGGTPYLLFGEGGVDDAEDADVLVHEYCHALSYYAAPESNSGRERKGLDEGIGDYFAAAVSQDLKPDFWQQLFNWDGHNEFWEGRVAVSSQTYPTSSLNIYDFGEIWASTLMEIRQQIGKDTLDRLVLQEMFMNFAGMTLAHAAQLMLDADTALFQGGNTHILNFYFCQRGLIQDSSSNCYVVNGLPAMNPVLLELFPNPNKGSFRLNWESETGRDQARINLYNSLGQTVFSQDLPQTGTYQIQTTLSPGLYILVMVSAKGKVAHHHLFIEP